MMHGVRGPIYQGRTIGVNPDGTVSDDTIMTARCGALRVRWQNLTCAVEQVTCPACRALIEKG